MRDLRLPLNVTPAQAASRQQAVLVESATNGWSNSAVVGSSTPTHDLDSNFGYRTESNSVRSDHELGLELDAATLKRSLQKELDILTGQPSPATAVGFSIKAAGERHAISSPVPGASSDAESSSMAQLAEASVMMPILSPLDQLRLEMDEMWCVRVHVHMRVHARMRSCVHAHMRVLGN
jgi:hypothetical protein